MRRRRIDPKPPFSQSAPAGKRAQSASVRFSGAIRCGISTTPSRASWHRLEYPPPRCYAVAGQTTIAVAKPATAYRGPATRRRRDNQTVPPRTCTASGTINVGAAYRWSCARRSFGCGPGRCSCLCVGAAARVSRRDHCATRAALHGSFLARSGPAYQSSNPAQG